MHSARPTLAELTLADVTLDESANRILQQVKITFDFLKCFRGAAAATSAEEDARVTRWRNVIRDLPKNDG